MMQWEREMEMSGKKTSDQGNSNEEKFRALVGDGKAQVEYTVGTQWNYGEAKVTCTVRLTCNQDEATITHAAFLAFETAKALCSQGLDILVPPLPASPLPPSAGPTPGGPPIAGPLYAYPPGPAPGTVPR